MPYGPSITSSVSIDSGNRVALFPMLLQSMVDLSDNMRKASYEEECRRTTPQQAQLAIVASLDLVRRLAHCTSCAPGVDELFQAAVERILEFITKDSVSIIN